MSLWIVVPALVGIVVGVISAMFGIGGGMVMVPIIRIFFDRSGVVASATSLFATVPTSITGVVTRRNDGTINFKHGILLGLFGSLASPLGARAATFLPGYIAMGCMVIVVFYTASQQFIKAHRMKALEIAQQEGSLASSASSGAQTQPSKSKAKLVGTSALVFSAVIGMIAGFLSGFLGVGGGFFIVPMLVSFLGKTMKEASGTSLVAVAILAIPGVISHAMYGNIDYLLSISFMIGAIPGAKLGSVLVHRFSNRRLTIIFGVVLVIGGFLLGLKELI